MRGGTRKFDFFTVYINININIINIVDIYFRNNGHLFAKCKFYNYRLFKKISTRFKDPINFQYKRQVIETLLGISILNHDFSNRVPVRDLRRLFGGPKSHFWARINLEHAFML